MKTTIKGIIIFFCKKYSLIDILGSSKDIIEEFLKIFC